MPPPPLNVIMMLVFSLEVSPKGLLVTATVGIPQDPPVY